MWLLVVTVAGMSIYSATFSSLAECQNAGRAYAFKLAKANPQGAGWNCTRIK